MAHFMCISPQLKANNFLKDRDGDLDEFVRGDWRWISTEKPEMLNLTEGKDASKQAQESTELHGGAPDVPGPPGFDRLPRVSRGEMSFQEALLGRPTGEAGGKE